MTTTARTSTARQPAPSWSREASRTPSGPRRVRPWWRSLRRYSRRPYVLLDGDEWRRTFDAYERDAWRFEAQPVYAMPREAENVARFLRGDPKPADHNARWHERVRGYVASGRAIGRVRVVR